MYEWQWRSHNIAFIKSISHAPQSLWPLHYLPQINPSRIECLKKIRRTHANWLLSFRGCKPTRQRNKHVSMQKESEGSGCIPSHQGPAWASSGIQTSGKVPLSFKANPKPELHAISVDLDTWYLLLSNLLTLIGDHYLLTKPCRFQSQITDLTHRAVDVWPRFSYLSFSICP